MSFFYMYSATGQLSKISIEEFASEKKESEEEKKRNAKTKNISTYMDLNNKYGRGYTILEVKNMISLVKDTIIKAKEKITPAVVRITSGKLKKILAENMAKSNKVKYDAAKKKEAESKSTIVINKGRDSSGSSTISEARKAELIEKKKQEEKLNIDILTEAKELFNSTEQDLKDTEMILADTLVSKSIDEVANFYDFCNQAFKPPQLTDDEIKKQLDKMYQDNDKDLPYIDENTYKYYYYSGIEVIENVMFVKKHLKSIKDDVQTFNNTFQSDIERIKGIYA